VYKLSYSSVKQFTFFWYIWYNINVSFIWTTCFGSIKSHLQVETLRTSIRIQPKQHRWKEGRRGAQSTISSPYSQQHTTIQPERNARTNHRHQTNNPKKPWEHRTNNKVRKTKPRQHKKQWKNPHPNLNNDKKKSYMQTVKSEKVNTHS
jgi:hypothetical protein